MRYQEILEACWSGYRQAGMKKKGDRMVPNCVPVEEVKTGPEITGKDLLFKAAAMAMRDASHEGISLDYEQAIRQASKIYGIPYQPSELPKLLAQRAEIDRQLALLKQGKQVAKARRREKLAPTPAGAEEYWKTHALPIDRIKPPTRTLEAIEEDLRKWFKEKWVRFGPDGKIRGDCARGSSKEGKPKCLPQSKAHALGKKGRASAAAKKRREDPNPERRGAAKNVATKVKEATRKPVPPKNTQLDFFDQQMADMYVKGVELETIGKQFNTSGQLVWHKLSKFPNVAELQQQHQAARQAQGLPILGKKNISDQTKKQMADLYAQGFNIREIGKKLGISHVGVWRILSGMPNIKQLKQSYYTNKLEKQYGTVAEQEDRTGHKMYQAKEKFLLSRDGKQIAFYDSIIQAQKDAERMQKELGGEVVVQRVMREQELDEKQDACYRKVKSRYKVWPSAYASGALVQCRKKGAANWGTGGKKK